MLKFTMNAKELKTMMETEENIKEINEMATLMTTEEIKAFVEDDYSYMFAPLF